MKGAGTEKMAWVTLPGTIEHIESTPLLTFTHFGEVVMVVSGETAGGTGSTSGKPGLAFDATLVFAAMGVATLVVGYRIRK